MLTFFFKENISDNFYRITGGILESPQMPTKDFKYYLEKTVRKTSRNICEGSLTRDTLKKYSLKFH